MAKNKETKQSRVVIFVEGDTDEVFFKALLDYYKSVSIHPLLPCEICNLRGVTRYASKLLAKLKNDYLPDARKNNYKLQTVCCSYDTDVFEVRNPLLVDWNVISKSVKRMGIGNFIRIGVKSSIEDWIMDDMEGICHFLKIKEVPKSLKGSNGNDKLSDLYSRGKRDYQKGYNTQELIYSLDMSVIRKKHSLILKALEDAIGLKESLMAQ